ncbi:MAG TPA: VOC family protein [Pseudonocardia sp.]|nr:VOC family protein [Pseudonocardia sp.]
MNRDVTGLHHVGLVVDDLPRALALYRRMGFRVPPPTFPTLPGTGPGSPARPVGAGNTHVAFPAAFVEIVAVAGTELPPGATAVPLEAPPDRLDRVVEGVLAVADRIAAALARFPGLHILVLETPDADVAAGRLTADGVPHGGVLRLRRPGGGGDVPLGVVEIDGAAGRTPEGRLALAEPLPAHAHEPAQLHHPNGACGLAAALLCVPDADLDEYRARYARYLRRPSRRDGPAHVFDLDRGRIVLVAGSDLDALLPGERPVALPAFVGCSVLVADPERTRAFLEGAGFPLRTTADGHPFVPAGAALGAAVVFEAGGSPG